MPRLSTQNTVLLLWSLLCLSALLSCSASYSAEPDHGLRDSFKRSLKDIAARKPAYVKGGASDPSKGLDCSGYLYLAGKWAGIPGMQRTTSNRMAQGLDGWTSDVVPFFTMAHDVDLAFWTWAKTPWKVNSHTGAFLRGEAQEKQGEDGLSVAHAGSRGVAIVPFRGVFVKDLSLIRRLHFGE